MTLEHVSNVVAWLGQQEGMVCMNNAIKIKDLNPRPVKTLSNVAAPCHGERGLSFIDGG